MEKKRPQKKRTSPKIIYLDDKNNKLSDKEIKAFQKQFNLKDVEKVVERKKSDKGSVYIDLAYPVKYKKGYEAIIVTGADGFEHFFYAEEGYWDYDGGGSEFQKGKLKMSKGIVGSVKVYLPVKSIKIGKGNKGLTIVDAKNKTYEFA
jgi:hypothetical protein